jgi:hypothetical protein
MVTEYCIRIRIVLRGGTMYTVDCHLRVADQKPCSLRHKCTVAKLTLSLLLCPTCVCSLTHSLGTRVLLSERCRSVSGIGCVLLLYYSVFAINTPKLAVLSCRVLVLRPCVLHIIIRLWAHSCFCKSCGPDKTVCQVCVLEK